MLDGKTEDKTREGVKRWVNKQQYEAAREDYKAEQCLSVQRRLFKN